MAKAKFQVKWETKGPTVESGEDVRAIRTPAEWDEINQRARDAFALETWGDQNFGAWDKYREWLLSVLPGAPSRRNAWR